VLNRCIIANNNSSDGGGAADKYSAKIRSCLFVSNTATVGGGLSFRADGAAYNTTVAHNEATSSGGGIYCTTGGNLWNTIIYFNTAPANANYYNAGSGMSYAYCCTTPAITGSGNISADPLFLNAAVGDFHLFDDSPCIDAGTNMSWMWSATDLDGNPRIIDGIVDMGAYEYIPEPVLFIIYYLLIMIYYLRKEN